jgi:ORF6N domain-containing protein
MMHFLRGQRLLLDSDLAELYNVSTKSLNQAVRRNRVRFPADFGFSLNRREIQVLRDAPIMAGPQRFRNPRYPPFAFTEHGAIRALMKPVVPASRPIGFTADLK